MDLKSELLHLDVDDRIALDPEGERLFMNLEKLHVRTPGDIAQIRDQVEVVCGSLDDRVDVIVNDDGIRIEEHLEARHTAMHRDLEDRFYRTMTRYAGAAFMRRKLGPSSRRDAALHVFESAEEARAFRDKGSGQA